jgi:hypothetical protein
MVRKIKYMAEESWPVVVDACCLSAQGVLDRRVTADGGFCGTLGSRDADELQKLKFRGREHFNILLGPPARQDDSHF